MKIFSSLVCPKDKCKLSESGDDLTSDCGLSFSKVNNKPILIINPKTISLRAPEMAQISENVEGISLPKHIDENLNARILHLGSGNVRCLDPRVISADLLPNDNVDVVCEGEHLPFADETFDYVTSGAVLEHVSNPIAVAAEMRRVLKVGGTLQSTVAFNQPYHGFPSHYFNWSPIAMETYLVKDFQLVKSGVAQDGTLAVTLTQSWDLFLEQLSRERREFFLEMPLKDALHAFRPNRSLENPNLEGVPQFALEQLCSAYEVIGVKLSKDCNVDEKILQSIYEQRRIILMRLQEIKFYTLKLFEKNGKKVETANYEIPQIPGFTSVNEASDFLVLLEEDERSLRLDRDKVIYNFLQ
jgi:SAM-dependent methyltransferase